MSHEYKRFGEEFCKKVGTLYENNIVIQNYSTYDELPKKHATLLISPIIIQEDLPADHLLQVLPFMNEKDISTLGNIINNIERVNKNQSLKKQLDQLFSEKLFSIGTLFETDMETIGHIIPIMERNGYVDSKHLQEVIDREKLSSTSFGRVAIPHSLKMDALKTGFYVLIQKKGIKWNKNIVHIVLLLTVNKNERRYFQDILESIADIMTTEKAIRRLLTVQNFKEFMHVLRSYLPE